jgi:hypothetical protein
MPANVFANGSADDTVVFDKPIGHLNVSVSSGTTFAISVDRENYLSLPEGFHSFPVGAITEVRIQSDGDWQLIAVQA